MRPLRQQLESRIDEVLDGIESGAITEVFACGTAAVITPIGQLKGKDFAVGDIDAPAGEVTMAIRKELTAQGQRAVEEVKRTGERVSLEPMTPFERKVVHDAVAAAGLVSESSGEEPNRFVVVLPA